MHGRVGRSPPFTQLPLIVIVVRIELIPWPAGVDSDLARQAVRSIGEIAVRVPSAAETVSRRDFM